MNYYETLYIVHPALEAGRLKDIILSIETIFSNDTSNIISTQVWGKKKLSYMIDKQKYGTYVLIQFESDGQDINTISTELEINPNILAHLTTKISNVELQKESRSLDEQIIGDKPANETDTENNKETKETKGEDSSEVVHDEDKTNDVPNNEDVSNEKLEKDNLEKTSNEEREE